MKFLRIMPHPEYDLAIPIPCADPAKWGDNLPRFIKAMEETRKPDGSPLRIVYLLNADSSEKWGGVRVFLWSVLVGIPLAVIFYPILLSVMGCYFVYQRLRRAWS